MAAITGVVIEGTERARRVLSGAHFWNVMERIIPRALTPVARAARAAAPRGKTGKLTRSPFEIRTRRQFALGTVIDAVIISKVGYGHLPEKGHRIIARGPARKGVRLTRAQRKTLRSALKERRAAGPLGFVPGQFFTRKAWESRQAETQRLIELLLAQELTRAV